MAQTKIREEQTDIASATMTMTNKTLTSPVLTTLLVDTINEAGAVISSAGYPIVEVSLSDANNAVSDSYYNTCVYGGSFLEVHGNVSKSKVITNTAKKTWYLITRTTNSGASRIDNDNSHGGAVIRGTLACL